MKTSLELLKFPIEKFELPKEITHSILQHWIDILEQFPSQISSLAKNLSMEELNLIYRPNGWNIKQVVHHCSDSHMNAFIRFKLALTEENPTIKPYKEALWAELIDGNENNISHSLQLLEGIHYKWCLLLKTLDESQYNRTYFHPESKQLYVLKEVVGLYAWHCNHHLAHIKQAILFQNKFN